jgi:hypothetical protein
MTASPAKKTTQLTPEEWKQLALLNVQQLGSFLQNIPGNTESGSAGLTEQHLQLIGGHLDRFGSFLRAWSLARVDVPPAVEVAEDDAAPETMTAKKGGWPKGKPRKAKEAEAA